MNDESIEKFYINYKINSSAYNEEHIERIQLIKEINEDSVTFKMFQIDGDKLNEIGQIIYFSNPIYNYIRYELSEFTETLKESSDIELSELTELTELSVRKDFKDFKLKNYSFEDILEYSLFKDRLENKVYSNNNTIYAHTIELLEVNKDFQGLGYGTLLLDIALKDIKNQFIDDVIILNASPMDSTKDVSELRKLYIKSGFSSFLNQGKNDNMVIEKESDIKIKNKDIVEKMFPNKVDLKFN